MNRRIEDVPFLTACKALVLDKGVAGDYRHSGWVGSDCRLYEDDTVRIVRSPDPSDETMEVIRLANDNPVAYVTKEGDCIRLHGEYNELTDHVEALADSD